MDLEGTSPGGQVLKHLEVASKVIDPAFNDFIKTVVPEYKVDAILGACDEVRSKAKDALAANLAQYHIIVDDIYIANIAFSDAFQHPIQPPQGPPHQAHTQPPQPGAGGFPRSVPRRIVDLGCWSLDWITFRRHDPKLKIQNPKSARLQASPATSSPAASRHR